MKYALKLKNLRGDTIVEVLVVLAVLGLAFAISYATANHGLIQARNAEEHSEALGLIDSQVELLRAAYVQQSTSGLPSATSGSSFCMINTGSAPAPSIAFTLKPTPAADSANGYAEYPTGAPGSCVNGFYHVSVTFVCTPPTGQSCVSDPTDGFYDFRIRWDGIGSLGPQQEELTYKISNSSLVGGTGTSVAATLPAPSWSWFIYGTYYDGNNDIRTAGYNPTYSGSNSCVPGDPVNSDDQSSWQPTNENGCDPAGAFTEPGVPPPCYGYTDTNNLHAYNNPVSPNTAMYARRDVTFAYDFNNPNATYAPVGGGNINAGGPATLVIGFQEYPGAGNTPPPAGYISSKAGTSPATPPYQFVLKVYINGRTAGNLVTTANLQPQPVNGNGYTPAPATPSNPVEEAFTTQPINLPANPRNIQLAWIDNEEDQNNNVLCTPNAQSYDPDLQVNYVQLVSS